MTVPVEKAGVYTGHLLDWGGGLTFIECNFTNRQPPTGCTVTKCNTTVRESCKHVDTDKVIIDLKTIELKKYADIIYGRYDAVAEKYEYHKDPIEIECKAPE